MVSRRTLLTAGAATAVGALAGGVAAVEQGLLPGRVELARLLGRCAGDAILTGDGPAADLRPASFGSAYRGRDVSWVLALPPGTAPAGLPVVLALHGRGADAHTAFTRLGLHHAIARHVAAGGRPFAMATADGGDTYWHPRVGDDPLGMLIHELLPRLAELGLRVDRIGAWGWSMGGFGALLLARESERDALAGIRVSAVTAASPALFHTFADATPGAFDDPADFTRWGALLDAPDVSATPLRVTCGDADAFTDTTREYRAAVHPTPAGGIEPGCHDPGFWHADAPQAAAFLAEHLLR